MLRLAAQRPRGWFCARRPGCRRTEGSAPPPALCLQPQPDQPLASCNQYERVWSFDPADWLAQHQPGGALAASLAATATDGGVTVWRAKAPTGYAVAGDVVTPGTSQARLLCLGCLLCSSPACSWPLRLRA